jgi:Tol biopolymer transport system component
VVNFGDLPATWTPSPTATSLPATETPPPPSDPGLFQVVFSGAENPVEPARLLLVRGDGSALETVEIEIIEEGPQPTPTLSAPPTLTSTPIEPSEEGTLVFEAEESTPDPGPSLNNPEAVAGFNRLEFTDPAWSPNGQEIAFTVQINEGQQEVFILNRASGRVRPITRFGASIVDGAAWSPDGRQVAVSSNYTPDGNNDRFNIYLIDVQTGEWQTLTDEEGQNREPNWAPDGRSLIFSSDRQTPGELEIWRIELATNQLTQLTNDINSSFSPQFSTDGARIAFISNRGGDNDLYIMRGDGSDERLITTLDEGADDRDPAWSPDDQWWLLSSNRQTGGALQLWLLQPDGTAWQVITEGLGNSRFPQWRSLEQ